MRWPCPGGRCGSAGVRAAGWSSTPTSTPSWRSTPRTTRSPRGTRRTSPSSRPALATEWTDRYGLRGRRILEVGCGKAEFLAMFCELAGATGVGIDPAGRLDRLAESALVAARADRRLVRRPLRGPRRRRVAVPAHVGAHHPTSARSSATSAGGRPVIRAQPCCSSSPTCSACSTRSRSGTSTTSTARTSRRRRWSTRSSSPGSASTTAGSCTTGSTWSSRPGPATAAIPGPARATR